MKTKNIKKAVRTSVKTEVEVQQAVVGIALEFHRGRAQWPLSCFRNELGEFDEKNENSEGWVTHGNLNTTFGAEGPDGTFYPLFGIQHVVQSNEERNQIRLIGPNSERQDFVEDDPEKGQCWSTSWFGMRDMLIPTVRHMLKTRQGIVPIRESNKGKTLFTTKATGHRGFYSPFMSGTLNPDKSTQQVTMIVGEI